MSAAGGYHMWVLFVASVWVGLLLGCSQNVAGETVRWRYPGLSGRWLDPHNWIGDTSGLPRVPGPNDDVILGGGYSFTYGAHYLVTLETRGTVKVKSLRLQMCNFCGLGVFRYVYDSATSQWVQISLSTDILGQCGIGLVVVPPTNFIVTGAFTLDSRSQLRLPSLPSQPQLSSSVKAGTWNWQGTSYGGADLYGNIVIAGGGMDVLRFYPDGSQPSATKDRPAKMTVHGDLDASIASINLFLDVPSGAFSVINVTGKATWPNVPIIFTPGPVASSGDPPTYPVFVFGNTTNTAIPNFLYIAPYQMDPFFIACQSTDTTSVSFAQQCGTSSSHSFGALLDSSTYSRSCCPAGLGGVNCDQAYCPGAVTACNSRGNCLNGICACFAGWQGFACELPFCPGYPRECSGHGLCYAPLPLGSVKPFCQCRTGWGGSDCSIPLCPNNCTAPSHGTCNTQGNSPKCICKVGYQPGINLDCALRAPYCPGQPLECSGHGVCQNSNCTCYSGWEGPDCSLPACPGGCSHHGVCVAATPGTGTKCQCDSGWSGPDCSVTACNGGIGCSGHGYCSPDLDPPRCICDGPTVLPAVAPASPAVAADFGWGGPACAVGFLPECSRTNCTSNGGTCGGDNLGRSCLINTCPAGFTGWDCSERICHNTGYPECNGHGNCELVGGAPKCVCRPGYTLGSDNSCHYATCEVTLIGNATCNGHGKCRTDLAVPICECEPYFYGTDCSNTTCPGYLQPCSGNGYCFSNGTCNCSYPWQGGDCSVPICPTTNGINCNSNGFCNSSSMPFFCQCYDRWNGTACDKAFCPNDCSGHGFCDDTLSPPACRCDTFYEGEDCSSTPSNDTPQDTMGLIIGVVVAGMVVVIMSGAAMGLVGYIIYRLVQAHKYRADLKQHNSVASVNF